MSAQVPQNFANDKSAVQRWFDTFYLKVKIGEGNRIQ